MAAIYQWFVGHEIVVTTTPYPVQMTESVVFGIALEKAVLREIPNDHWTFSFDTNGDGTLIQLRWFYTDPGSEDDWTFSFETGQDGTLIQLRWFYADGPYEDQWTFSFSASDGTLILTRIIVEANTGSAGKPYEELWLGCTINDTLCSMDLI